MVLFCKIVLSFYNMYAFSEYVGWFCFIILCFIAKTELKINLSVHFADR